MHCINRITKCNHEPRSISQNMDFLGLGLDICLRAYNSFWNFVIADRLSFWILCKEFFYLLLLLSCSLGNIGSTSICTINCEMSRAVISFIMRWTYRACAVLGSAWLWIANIWYGNCVLVLVTAATSSAIVSGSPIVVWIKDSIIVIVDYDVIVETNKSQETVVINTSLFR